jgi:hypothetical protein
MFNLMNGPLIGIIIITSDHSVHRHISAYSGVLPRTYLSCCKNSSG